MSVTTVPTQDSVVDPVADAVAWVTRALSTRDDAEAAEAFEALAGNRAAVTLLLDDPMALHALAEAPPRRNTAFWDAVSQALGAPAEPADDALLRTAENEERRFGTWFAELADAVPAAKPGGPQGLDRLLALVSPLARIRQDHLSVLLATASAQGTADAAPGIAEALATRGLTPLSFLHAARAVGHLLRLATRSGTLASGTPVSLATDGQLGHGWAGNPAAAVKSVGEAVEVGEAQATVLLRWVVAASEVSPFLILRQRATMAQAGSLVLTPLTKDELELGLDAPAAAWTFHQHAALVHREPAFSLSDDD